MSSTPTAYSIVAVVLPTVVPWDGTTVAGISQAEHLTRFGWGQQTGINSRVRAGDEEGPRQ
jgi:hypothetical protein